MSFHLIDQTDDARVAFLIAAGGVIGWAIWLIWNVRWLRRANGHRPFVSIILWTSAAGMLLSLSFPYNSARTHDVTNDWGFRISYYLNRALVAAGPVVLWQLRRKVGRKH